MKTFWNSIIFILTLLSLNTWGGGDSTSHEWLVTGKGKSTEKRKKKLDPMSFTPLFSTQESEQLKHLNKEDLSHSVILKFNSIESILPIQKQIKKNKWAISLEENATIHLKTVRRQVHTISFDPLFHEQWALKNTGQPQKEFIDYFDSRVIQGVPGEDAHPPLVSSEGKGVTVAVLDTGVDLNHPDLKNQINGGWNMIGKGSPLVKDTISHGTHVAGIIAGEKNQLGIQGIAPRAKILPIQVITDNPNVENGMVSNDLRASALTSTVAKGILYAVQAKAQIINLSLGWNGRADSPLVREMIQLADENGILVVAAAGNDGTDALVFPCQYTEVICVGAHDPDGQISRFSNYGSGVSISAPGLNILSSIPLDIDPDVFTDMRGYDFKDGTSMAAPFVSGALAILLSEGFSPHEAKARLLLGARKKAFSEERMVLTGNLDLTQSLAVIPQPFFEPINKGVIPSLWNPTERKIQVQFPIKNIWKKADLVSLRLRPSRKDQNLETYQISTPQQEIQHWGANEIRNIKFEIDILKDSLSSELGIILEISSQEQHTSHTSQQTLFIPIQVSVVLRANQKLKGANYLPVLSGTVLPDSTLYTIRSLDEKNLQDYLAIKKEKDQWLYQLIRQVKTPQEGYLVGDPKIFPALDGGIRTLLRLDLNFDGKSEYVFTSLINPIRNSPSSSRVPYFQFEFLDESLDPVYETHLFINEKTVLQLEKFQWIRWENRLVPAWVDLGELPQDEKNTRFNPWNPKPKSSIEPRLYFYQPTSSDGLGTIPTPPGKQIITLLQSPLGIKPTGKVTALFSDSLSYVTPYYTSEIDTRAASDPSLLLSSFHPVQMNIFRNLRSLDASQIISLYPHLTRKPLSLFSGFSGTHSQKITALLPQLSEYQSFDLLINSNSPGDPVYRVIRTFLNSDPKIPFLAAFAQGQYEIKYKENRSEKVFETSLRKYTFLASALFERSFYPTVAENNHLGIRVPALQIPDGFGAYPGAEVIVPEMDEQGNTIALIRPAKLRILVADPSCEWLASMQPTQDSPSQAVYFCQNQFIQIPYRW